MSYHNSLTPGRFDCNLILMLKLNLVIDGWCFSCEIALWWLSLDLADDKSILVQVIKSARYTGGDFMFLYRFVRRRVRRRRLQILVHAITFEQLFGFLSFLAQLLALTYRLTD